MPDCASLMVNDLGCIIQRGELKAMQTNVQSYGVTTALPVLLLILSAGTVSADDRAWAAKPNWDAPDDVKNGSAPVFVDIDVDSDYDLFIGEQMGVSFAYTNTGSVTSAGACGCCPFW